MVSGSREQNSPVAELVRSEVNGTSVDFEWKAVGSSATVNTVTAKGSIVMVGTNTSGIPQFDTGSFQVECSCSDNERRLDTTRRSGFLYVCKHGKAALDTVIDTSAQAQLRSEAKRIETERQKVLAAQREATHDELLGERQRIERDLATRRDEDIVKIIKERTKTIEDLEAMTKLFLMPIPMIEEECGCGDNESGPQIHAISPDTVATVYVRRIEHHDSQIGGAALTPNEQSIPHMLILPSDHEDIYTRPTSAESPPCMRHPVVTPQKAHIKQSLLVSDDETSTASVYFSLSNNEDNELSSFACLRTFQSSSSLSSPTSPSSSSSSSSRNSESDSESSLMSSDSSSRASIFSMDCMDSSISSTLPTSSTSIVPKAPNASAAWSHRRERMARKKELQLSARGKKLRSRDKFLKRLSKGTASGPAHSKIYANYMKENEARARVKCNMTSEGIISRARCHVLFELFHSAPAGMTQLLFCITHVAIYEFFQCVVQDFLELNEYDNQFLVYVCVFFVAFLMSRACGNLWEWTSDETYNNVRFDMHNKRILGDADARILQWFNGHPRTKHVFEIISLYLCYLSANHFITETMMKNLFDVREEVIEDLPSMQFPDVTTHIKNVLFYGEALFEDSSLATAEHGSASSSTACSVLGGDLCDERIFQACNTLDEFRANLTAADGEFLYDEVSFDTYYKIIGDTSAGVYYYEGAMVALLCVALAGAFGLKRIGVGFWEH